MVNMRDNNEVKEFIAEKISYLENKMAEDKEDFSDPIFSQQARGRFYRGEWCMKILNEIKEMLI